MRKKLSLGVLKDKDKDKD